MENLGFLGGYNVAYGVQLDKMEKNAVSAWDAGEIWGNAKNRMKFIMAIIFGYKMENQLRITNDRDHI